MLWTGVISGAPGSTPADQGGARDLVELGRRALRTARAADRAADRGRPQRRGLSALVPVALPANDQGIFPHLPQPPVPDKPADFVPSGSDRTTRLAGVLAGRDEVLEKGIEVVSQP